MPGYDKSGPVGSGPMTGRKNGRCTGNEIDGNTLPFGRGGRRKMGRGFSNGFGNGRLNMRNVSDAEGSTMQNTIEQLKDQVNSLKEELAKYKETR